MFWLDVEALFYASFRDDGRLFAQGEPGVE